MVERASFGNGWTVDTGCYVMLELEFRFSRAWWDYDGRMGERVALAMVADGLATAEGRYITLTAEGRRRGEAEQGRRLEEGADLEAWLAAVGGTRVGEFDRYYGRWAVPWRRGAYHDNGAPAGFYRDLWIQHGAPKRHVALQHVRQSLVILLRARELQLKTSMRCSESCPGFWWILVMMSLHPDQGHLVGQPHRSGPCGPPCEERDHG